MASRGRGGFTAAPTVSSDRLRISLSQLVQATTDRISKELLLREAQQGDPLLLSAFAANPSWKPWRKEYVSKESEYAKLSIGLPARSSQDDQAQGGDGGVQEKDRRGNKDAPWQPPEKSIP